MHKQPETMRQTAVANHSPSRGVKSARRIWWGRVVRAARSCIALLAATFVWAHAGLAEAQGFQRWFQVEMTIFSNESGADREREFWDAANAELSYPPDMVRLGRLTDLLFLDWLASEPATDPLAPELERLRDTGPFPAREASSFRFPDLRRDPFLELPAAYSDFRQTNQAIERAGQYRVLYDAVWRQPVGDEGAETPVLVAGGGRFGALTELQGSVALYFNANRDRVIFSADLWLVEFGGATDGGEWSLPPLPEEFRENAGNSAAAAISRVFTMRQQRELRSGEFHYLDHPALGIVVQITPYDRPPSEPTENQP